VDADGILVVPFLFLGHLLLEMNTSRRTCSSCGRSVLQVVRNASGLRHRVPVASDVAGEPLGEADIAVRRQRREALGGVGGQAQGRDEAAQFGSAPTSRPRVNSFRRS
jgi:hypothetical protein